MTSGTDTGSSNGDDITSDSTPTFVQSAACTNGETITIYVDAVVTADTFVCVGGAYNITLTNALSDGIHAITITTNNGSESPQSTILNITVDTSADAAPTSIDLTTPTDTGSSSSDNITSGLTPNFTVACVTDSMVTIYDGLSTIGTGLCVAGTVTITAVVPLVDSTHNITATQTDPAGNISPASAPILVVVVDSTDTSCSCY